MSTQFELWVRGCEDNKTAIFRLEHNGAEETGMYQTVKTHMHEGFEYRETPVYFVWIRGKNTLATTNYIEAVQTWEREKRN